MEEEKAAAKTSSLEVAFDRTDEENRCCCCCCCVVGVVSVGRLCERIEAKLESAMVAEWKWLESANGKCNWLRERERERERKATVKEREERERAVQLKQTTGEGFHGIPRHPGGFLGGFSAVSVHMWGRGRGGGFTCV